MESVVLDGVAHRPRFMREQFGERFVQWYRPRCLPPYELGAEPEKTTPMGAGWAHHLGYPGCAECWKDIR